MGYAGIESDGVSITLGDGNYAIRLADTYGDGWNGNVFSLTHLRGTLLGNYMFYSIKPI